MQIPDYLVVGSGLAGLSFAALMAHAGRRVIVLEAHEHAGGYGHTFDVGGYRFNAQLHYVWNTAPERTVGRVLARLGLADSLPFVPLDPTGYDHMRIPGYALDIPCVPSISFFPVQAMDIPRCAPEIPPPIPVTPGVQRGQDSAPSG